MCGLVHVCDQGGEVGVHILNCFIVICHQLVLCNIRLSKGTLTARSDPVSVRYETVMF